MNHGIFSTKLGWNSKWTIKILVWFPPEFLYKQTGYTHNKLRCLFMKWLARNTMYDEKNNSVSTVLYEHAFKILWRAETYPVLPKLEIAHSEWEGITGYYHHGNNVEMLSIAKIANPIVCSIKRHIWNCLKVKLGQNWTYLGLSLYYWAFNWVLSQISRKLSLFLL